MKKLFAPLMFAAALAFTASASATLVDDFSTGGVQSTVDFGGNVTFTSSIPVATGTGWTRQFDLRATGDVIQNINALVTGGVLTNNYLSISETANSKGLRVLNWDTITSPIAVGLNDVIDFDFRNVDQAFKLTLDLNAFNNPLDFIINPGNTNFTAPLSNWFAVGDTINNITALITSDNRGVDLEIRSVSTHVPEPETFLMIIIGLLGLGLGLKNDRMFKVNESPMVA